MFFDDHPRLLETSKVATNQNRLNLRHLAIFGDNAHHLRDATVLDIASHDGRWTLAALEAGARHVTGVEARPELTANAVANLGHYGMAPDRYDMVTADVFDHLGEPAQVDVVMCLGFWYHTLRYGELLSGIVRTGAATVVVDTRTIVSDEPDIRLEVDHTARQGHAVDDPFGAADRVLTGTPSHAALQNMFDVYGFEVAHRVDWNALVADRDPTGVRPYLEGRRVTWTLRRRG
jgi:hypothetical protein